MENIINIIKTFFKNVEKRDWEKVQKLMRDTILFEYSSINGNSATELKTGNLLKTIKHYS